MSPKSPTDRQLEILAAWWYSKGSNVQAAFVLGRHPQTIKNTLVLAVPSPAISRRPCNRTTATERWQILAQRITNTQAAVPARLHALDLGHRKHGVAHQLVIEEDGVVVPAHVREDTP